jgi:hypothetical protein
MMGYDMSKTLNENLLEQSDYAIDRRSAALMNAAGITSDNEYKQTLKDINTSQSNVIKVDSSSIPELLDKSREFFFSPGGMTTQIILSILGSEIGLPVVFEVLDIAILINDVNDMINGWKQPTQKVKNFEEWFVYQWDNNRGFQKVIEDILIIMTGGIIKLLGKGGKVAYTFFKSKIGTKAFESVIETSEKVIQSKKSFISKLPNVIKDWVNKKISQVEKGITLLKTAPKEVATGVIKKIPRAALMGGIGYASMVALGYVIKKWTDPKIDIDEVKNYLIAFNPFLVNQWVTHKAKKPDEGGIYWYYGRDTKGNFYISFDQTWTQLDGQDSKDAFELFIAERAYSKINIKVSIIDRTKGIFEINGVKYQSVNIDGADWKVKRVGQGSSWWDKAKEGFSDLPTF